MIKVEQVTKCFGAVKAVDDLSFEVLRGEIIGLLGPNGAGKTTLLRLLATYLAPSKGRILIGGQDIFLHSLEARRRLGYLPENAPLYPEMRVDEYLSFRAKLKGVSRRRRRDRMEEVKVLCGIKDVERRIIGQLSKGFCQRLALADSLVHNPELLILDEPAFGLDPNQMRAMRELIRSLAGRFTIVLATHLVAEAEAICQRVFIMSSGRIVASDSPATLIGQRQGHIGLLAEIAGPPDEVVEGLRGLNGISRVLPAGPAVTGSGSGSMPYCRYRLEPCPDADIRLAVFQLAAARGWRLRELSPAASALEDAYFQLTLLRGNSRQTP
ncbi:MAG: ATP-binding cassette domain-containing protein, partial [Lentisphaerae bacterium]|nr:ATP-binding cassette domain-containing protein [Lentisphaerota bacterium]